MGSLDQKLVWFASKYRLVPNRNDWQKKKKTVEVILMNNFDQIKACNVTLQQGNDLEIVLYGELPKGVYQKWKDTAQ